MKKVLSLLAVAGLIAAASSAFGASIVNSKHDLSPTGGASISGGTSTQICVYCHAPHNAAKSLPLWNRVNPAGSLFRLYSGVNMASTSFASGFTADSTSLFCMSCHDGLTQMSAVHNAGVIESPALADAVPSAAGAANARRTNTANFAGGAIGALRNEAIGGYNLTKTHPINFPVVATDTQSDLFVGSGSTMGKTNFTMPLFKLTGDRATSRSLECGSCHAVHDTANSPFLRYTMDGSALCLGCHNK